MAGNTVGRDSDMVKIGRDENGSRVTKVTILPGRHMKRRLAGADDIVMAGGTVINDAGMIEVAAGEGARGMTNPAIIGRRQVIGGFASRVNAMA